MILSCPKFQRFSLFVNLQIGSVLCEKKQNKKQNKNATTVKHLIFTSVSDYWTRKRKHTHESDKVLTGTGSNAQW